MRYYYRERKNDTKGKGESESNTWRDSDSAQYRAKNRAWRLSPIEKIRVKKMSFFENSSNYKLLLRSLQKRKLLLSPDKFNNISDYLLLKRHIRQIKDFEEKDGYVVARYLVKIPVRYGYWYRKENDIRVLERFLIIGFSENDKIVVFISTADFQNTSVSFGFDKDISRFNYIDVTSIVEYDSIMRVQGDIVIRVVRVENSKSAFLNALYESSLNTISRILDTEVHRRIADILSDIGISSTTFTNEVEIIGCPRNLKLEKLFSFLTENLVLSDIFPQYNAVVCEDFPTTNLRNRILLYNEYNKFFLTFTGDTIRRIERELHIRAEFQSILETNVSPYRVFFDNLVRETNLLESVNEEENHEILGRHRVTIKSAYPRTVSIEYEFPLSHRRYNIVLNTHGYVTSGTEIIFEHIEHGIKTVKVPAARLFFWHVRDPYRTTAAKNLLILRHYFT